VAGRSEYLSVAKQAVTEGSICLNDYKRKVIVLQCVPYPSADFLSDTRNDLFHRQISKAARELVKPHFAKLLLFGIERLGYAVREGKHNVSRS
jgi:hypothetical protein